MRATNEAFEAEVLRRSEVYKQKQRTRRKQLTAGMLTLCVCFGAFGFWRMAAGNRNLLATENKTADLAGTIEANGDMPADAAGQNDGDIADTAAAESALKAEEAAYKGIEKPLELKAEQAVYSPDTTAVVLLITNPNGQTVSVEPQCFTLQYEDGSGMGMGIAPAPPAEESSAVDSALTIGAGETLSYTLELSQFDLHTPLSVGTYRVSCTDLPSEEAVFIVEVS